MCIRDRLYKEHGKTLNFLGVIMSNLNVALEQKERSALFVAQIAKSLGAVSYTHLKICLQRCNIVKRIAI